MPSSGLLRSGLWILLVSGVCGAQSPPPVAKLGPQIGDRIPAFSGTDQFGRVQTLDSVTGKDGAMVVLFRSADW